MSDSDTTRIRLGALRHIDVSPGSMVLVREGDNDCFGAMVRKVHGATADLTFTPRGKPRQIPLGMILSAVAPPPATMNLSSVPRYQPEPTLTPRRRKVRG